MTAHKLSTYLDGYRQIPYCLNCGAEGLALHDDCGHVEPDLEAEKDAELRNKIKKLWNDVDKFRVPR